MANKNLNYNYLNPTKFFINKIWNEKIINNYDKGLNNLNNAFNEKLDLVVQLESNTFSTGRYVDDSFNTNNYGISSLKKITSSNLITESVDKYYLVDILLRKKLYNVNHDEKIINKIDSNKLYNYFVIIKEEPLFIVINDEFNSEIKYSIEIYDKSYKNLYIKVENPSFNNDTLQFYNDELIKNPENVSVLTNEQYYVIDVLDYSEVVGVVFNSNPTFEMNDKIKIYYQENEIYYVDFVNTKYRFTNLSVDELVKYIKFEINVVINEYNYFDNNKTFIKFLNNFDFFLNNSEEEVLYVKYDNEIYKLEYDSELELYYVASNIFGSNVTNNINLFTPNNFIISLFKFLNFYDESIEDFRYCLIELNRNLNNYIYDVQRDEDIPSNITSNVEDIIIRSVKIKTGKKLFLKYTLQNNQNIESLLNNSISYNYRLKESINYQVRSVTPFNNYLYKISNIFNLEGYDDLQSSLIFLYDFNDENLNSIELDCNIFNVDEDYIKFIVPLSSGLLNYNDNEILKSDEIINDSILNIFRDENISEKILKDYAFIKQYIFANSEENYETFNLIFEISDNFIFSHYYEVPDDIVLINDDIINVNDNFFNPSFLKKRYIVSLISDLLWNSYLSSNFKTPVPELKKQNDISINFEASFFELILGELVIWSDTVYNDPVLDYNRSNMKEYINNENIKIIKIKNKFYGLVRAVKNYESGTFSSNLASNTAGLQYSIAPVENVIFNLNIKQIFSIDKTYELNYESFNNSASNISLTKIKFLKNNNNFVSLLNLISNINYNYKFKFISEENFIITNILNIKYFRDYIEIEVEDNIIINSSLYTEYILIESIKNKEITKNEYFEQKELELKSDIPIFLNRGDYFQTQLNWVDNNLNNIPYSYTYYTDFTDFEEWDFTKKMYIVVNNTVYEIFVISFMRRIYLQDEIEEDEEDEGEDEEDEDEEDRPDYIYTLLFSTNVILQETDYVELNSNDWGKSIDLTNIKENLNNSMDVFNKILFYKYVNDYSKIIFFSKYKELAFFDKIAEIYPQVGKYYIDNENSNNRLILRFKYEEIKLINNSYKNIGLNKIDDIIEYRTTSEKEIYDPIWVKDLQTKFFKSIELLFDDEIIEKIDGNMLRILYNFNFNIFKETSFDKIIRIKKDDSGISFSFPLKLFFTTIYKFLPVCLMKKSNISINFNIESLNNLISNFGTIENTIKPILDISYTTFVLQKQIIKNLKEKQKFLLAPVCYNYNNSILTNDVEILHTKIYNMVKDLFIVVDDLTYTDENEFVRDNWYSNYKEILNTFNNNPNDVLVEDRTIFNVIINEIELGSDRVNLIQEHPLLSEFEIQYVLYLDEKYLSYLNEDLNNHSFPYSKKLTILILYFKNIYKEEIVPRQNCLEKLIFKMDGLNISPDIKADYYNDVIPYLKGYTLENNHYVYSFGLNSRVKQPNGHVNLKLIEDFSIQIEKKSNVKRAKIKLYSKEYKIINFNNDRYSIIN
jgi:hypothetical protein